MFKRRRIVFVIRRLIESSVSIKKFKRKPKLTFFCIFLTFTLIYFVYKTSLLYLLYKLSGFKSYDLMGDALKQQRIDQIKLDCKHDQEGQMVHDKMNLFETYYTLRPFESELAAFELPFDHLDRSSLEPSFVQLMSKLRLCSLGKLRMRFESKTTQNDSSLEKLLLDKKLLRSSELRRVDSVVENLKPGGIYSSPMCLQQFLFDYSSWSGLEAIRKLVNNYDSRSQTRQQFLKAIVNSTFPIIKNLASQDSRIASEFLARKKSTTLILVPYLNRRKNLIDFLYNMHSFLQRQFISYMIVVAEQFNSNDAFNKGKLYNAAFNYLKIKHRNNIKIGCVVFHDVDLLPETDTNLYECDWRDDSPRHLSVAVRKTEENGSHDVVETKKRTNPRRNLLYKTYYDFLVGGVLCMKPDVYELLNGFSNEYFKWGGEDDDLGMRMRALNVCIRRPPPLYSAYRMSTHQKSDENPMREILLFSSVRRMNRDGLSNIDQVSSVVDFVQYGFYSKILIDVGRKSFWKQIKQIVF